MEFVYVVRRRELFPDCYPQGFAAFAGAELRARTVAPFDWTEFRRRVSQHGFFVERERAEREPAWKQIIPYCLVTREGTASSQMLVLKRTSRGGEARLHDKLSVGIGGHIDPADAEPRSEILLAGARRELDEELHLQSRDRAGALEVLGLINDDSNAVGAVHLGLVLRLPTAGPVAVRETNVLEGEFRSVSDLTRSAASGAPFETWSAKLLTEIDFSTYATAAVGAS
jgi:predicted NUDIX family phosphoesterase